MRRKPRSAQWKRVVRYWYVRLLRLRATPHQISKGFACGVFWGVLPLPGFQILGAVLTATLLGGSKLAAAAATWLSNPVTLLPMTAFNFHIGQILLRRSWSSFPIDQVRNPKEILQLGGEIVQVVMVGSMVVGIIAAIATYFVGVPILSRMQQQRMQRRYPY